MFYKYNNVTGKTLTVKLNESNLFEMKTREIVEEKNLLKLDSSSIINFYFNYRLLPKYSSVTSVILKFDLDDSEAIFNINNEYSLVSFTSRIIDSFKFDTKVEIDLTNYFDSIDSGYYFSIDSKNEFSIYKDSIALEFNYISLEESLVNQEYLNESFGDFSYKLNIRTGRIVYYYDILNISNSPLNINLKLLYDLDYSNSSINSMPVGFRFNYAENISYDFYNNVYLFKDINGNSHIFIQSINDTKCFVDVGGTYLVLHVYDDKYEIINDNIKHIFDKKGLLIKITKKIFMNNYENFYSLIFTYDSSQNLIKISEDNIINGQRETEDKVNIKYHSNEIIVSSIGFLDTTIIKDEINQLDKICKSNRYTSLKYNNNLLVEANNDSNRIINFKYNSNQQITQIKVEDKYLELISEENISYSYLSTIIVDNLANRFRYIFDNEGKLLSKVESIHNSEIFSFYYKKTENNLLYYQFNNDRYIAYEDINVSSNYDGIETVERFLSTDLSKDKLEFERDKEYILVFTYFNRGFKRNKDKLDYVYYNISINQEGHVVSELNLSNSNYNKLEIIRFKSISGSNPYIYLKYGYFKSNITISNLKIFEVSEVINNKYLNKYTNDNNSLILNKIYFYPYNNKQFYCDGKYYSNFVYFNDLVQNIKNFNLKENNFFDCFYNEGRSLVSNVQTFLLDSYTGPLSINDLIIGDYIENDELITFNYYDFKDEEFYRQIDILKNSDTEKITKEIVYNKNNEIIISYDENRLVTRNKYDDYSNLIESKTYNSKNEQKFYLKKFKYSKKNIITDISYINNREILENYKYDNNGLNLLSISVNNDLVINYEYYDNLKLKKIYTIINTETNENNINYDYDQIKSLNSNNNYHTFEYDKYNKISSYNDLFKIKRQIIENKMIENISYNDDSYNYTNIYDQYGRLIGVKENVDIIKYIYSNKHVDYITELDDKNNVDFKSKLRIIKDLVINNTIKYYYDKYNNINKVVNSNLEHYFDHKIVNYDKIKRINKYEIGYDDLKFIVTYKYEDSLSDKLSEIDLSFKNNVIRKTINKDMYFRINTMNLFINDKLYLSSNIEYSDDCNSLNDLVKTITYYKNNSILDKYDISYNDLGKIIKLKNNVEETQYFYDELGRLIKDSNLNLGKENRYLYDNNGNLLKVIEMVNNNEVINKYEYLDTNNDLLIKYNNLDIKYKNNNIVSIGNIKYEYVKNKYLSKVSLSENEEIFYRYDSFGNRVIKKYIKNNIEVVHKYLIDEEKILREKINEEIIDYIYLDRNLIGFIYKDNFYYYLKNIFGDITKILDNSGNVVAKYNYDAYGTCYIELNINDLANINPFRYRGYYYDKEVDLYYCKNRYYSPMLCRWISSDSIEYLNYQQINGLNLFSYCGNDPINNIDPNGTFFISVLLVGFVTGAAIAATSSVIRQGVTKGFDKIDGWQVLLDATIGGISGALGTSGISAIGNIIANSALGVVGSVGEDLLSSNGDWSQVSISSAIVSGIIGGVTSRTAGSQNKRKLAQELLENVDINKTLRTLYNSTNKYIAGNMSKRGFTGTVNLYSKKFNELVSAELPKIIRNETIKNLKPSKESVILELISWII